MDGSTSGRNSGRPNKIWSNAVNTLLSAMESILLDDDLQPLWPREFHSQDSKKKSFLPSTPTAPSPHDPTFSPPLKRKKDPLPPSDRNSKSQRMTDHLTARLATSLHVSSSVRAQSSFTDKTGLENSRGFYRVQEQAGPATSKDSSLGTAEPRKYKKAIRSRSNPTTPVSSHPPSPGAFSHDQQHNSSRMDDMFSAGSYASFSLASGSALESFVRNTAPSSVVLDPKRSIRSSLFMRRESRINQENKIPPPHLPMATRLALFHRILSTTINQEAQARDKETWIMEQSSKRGFPDTATFEAALTSHAQILVQALGSFSGSFPQSLANPSLGAHEQEIAIYTRIQTIADAILEHAHWLCGPDFEMGINRICPQWSVHERSTENIVHYVQVVESMRETVSGQFQHPIDLAEDLMRSQEVIDYQRTLFGETLRSQGLEWRAMGLPPMEVLIQGTQDWILNLAKTLTVKIRAEVNLALEQAHAAAATAASGNKNEIDLEAATLGPAVNDAMEFILQGGLLTRSCLELVGKPCAMLVTAWMELAYQYCFYALSKRQEQMAKASRSGVRRQISANPFSMHMQAVGVSGSSGARGELSKAPSSSLNRGVFLKTMELFENVGRLLQCVLEMREEEKLEGETVEDAEDWLGGGLDDDDSGAVFGASAASSDQDESMDMATSSVPSSSAGHMHDSDPYHAFAQSQRARTAPYSQRRLPMDPSSWQRRLASESLASILVESGLELCGSMAEALGSGYRSPLEATNFNPSLSNSTYTSERNPSSSSSHTHSRWASSPSSFPRHQAHTHPYPRQSGFGSGSSSLSFIPSFTSHDVRSFFSTQSSSARAAAAVSCLTNFAGGSGMASGTGGVGLIYVQFVVRLISKIFEFAGQDSRQEQRLLRVHSSLQNLESALSAT